MPGESNLYCKEALEWARKNGGIQLSRLQKGDRVVLYFDALSQEDFLVLSVCEFKGTGKRFYFVGARGSVNMWYHIRKHISGCTFTPSSSSLMMDWLYLGCCPVLGPITLPPVRRIHLNGFDILPTTSGVAH